MIALKRQCFRR